MSSVLYLRSTESADPVFTSTPMMFVYVLAAWARLVSKDRPSFPDGS